MRTTVARCLRKWADLIDPRTDPTDGVSIKVTVDASEAEAALSRVGAAIERLNSLDPKFLISISGSLETEKK